MPDLVTKPAEETVNLLDPDALDGVSAAEVKSVVDKIAAAAITNFEVMHTVTLCIANTCIVSIE